MRVFERAGGPSRSDGGFFGISLLVQSGERRNAENLSETVPASARVMQRFLAESPWNDDTVIGRLQEYLGPRLGHPEAVWVLDGSDFPKQGRKSVGVARQYCGRLGKVANCQAGMFLAYVSPLGRALVDKGLYLPESWTSDQDRCEAAGVPEERQGYRSKTQLALEMLQRALERGHLRAGWVAGDDAFGMSPSFRERLAALGMRYVLDVPGGTTVWPLEPAWTSPEHQGVGRPRKPRLVGGQRRTMEERSDELTEGDWREITVAEGSQGPRSYLFSAQRVRPTSRRKPGEIHWAVYRRNLDGSEPPAESKDSISFSAAASRSSRRAPSSNVQVWKETFSRVHTRWRRTSRLTSARSFTSSRERSIWFATASELISASFDRTSACPGLDIASKPSKGPP